MLSRRRAATVVRANRWDGSRLEHLVQVSRSAAAMLKLLLSLRGCGSSGRFASRGGRFWSPVQAAIRGVAGSEVMTLDLLARMRDSLQLNA